MIIKKGKLWSTGSLSNSLCINASKRHVESDQIIVVKGLSSIDSIKINFDLLKSS